MGEATMVRSVRQLVDSKRILDVLLRNLIQKKKITHEDMNTVLGITVRKVADTVHAQAISILMVDDAAKCIRFQNVYYSPSLYGLDLSKRKVYENKARELESMTLSWGTGIVGEVISNGKSKWVPNARKDASFTDTIDQATGFVTHSIIAVPLMVGDRAVGCIEVMNKSPEAGLITEFTEEDVKLLEEVAEYSAKVIQRALHPETELTEVEMARFVARLSKNEFIEIAEDDELDTTLITFIGEENLKRYLILPLAKVGENQLRCAVVNPLDFQNVEDFEIVTGMKVTERFVATLSNIEECFKRIFKPDASEVSEVAESIAKEFEVDTLPEVDVGEDDDEHSAPVVKLANRIVEDAYVQGSSDIHIEPFEKKVTVRYRIDGMCREKLVLPKQIHRALISRLKIMSDLDIAEHRIPQDGRIVFKKFNSRYDLDLRVSIAPMNHGEKVCMRILDKTKSTLPLEKLGFSQYNLELYRELIEVPYGMILHCGPTGSGKSMTLYAALNEINDPDTNICTAEDPIEYTLGGINQLQVKKDIGLTFSAALRCFLRQDPDIILVGEVRDQETAEIAIEAALTGHVLFSTLHTNDAPSTITRLVEMGIEPFMISTSLVCICAQRLMRRLCICAEETVPEGEVLEYMKRSKDAAPVSKCKEPRGCSKCGQTGYKGRTGIHELLRMTDDLRGLINKGATAEDLKTEARRAGMRTLFEDSMEKVKSGVSSMTEALATARPDDTIV